MPFLTGPVADATLAAGAGEAEAHEAALGHTHGEY